MATSDTEQTDDLPDEPACSKPEAFDAAPGSQTRGKTSITTMLAMAAAIGMGGFGTGMFGLPAERRKPEPTQDDFDRIRLAKERQKVRAAKKAEMVRRSTAGKSANEY